MLSPHVAHAGRDKVCLMLPECDQTARWTVQRQGAGRWCRAAPRGREPGQAGGNVSKHATRAVEKAPAAALQRCPRLMTSGDG